MPTSYSLLYITHIIIYNVLLNIYKVISNLFFIIIIIVRVS